MVPKLKTRYVLPKQKEGLGEGEKREERKAFTVL